MQCNIIPYFLGRIGGVLKRGQIAVRKPLVGASRTILYARAPWWAHSDSTAIYPTLGYMVCFLGAWGLALKKLFKISLTYCFCV